MAWLFDPTIWVGLLTLIALEVVLGTDQLIFTDTLADKLPTKPRNRVRVIGLLCGLLLRLVVLLPILWLMQFSEPLLALGQLDFSVKDLVCLIGGFFLLFIATQQLYERIGGDPSSLVPQKGYAGFGVVLLQLVVLQAMLSVDAVFIAIATVDQPTIMVLAMVVATALLLAVPKVLTHFINTHPNLVVLVFGFLLMIGFSLILNGFGIVVPKGYLYAAIGFAVAVGFVKSFASRQSSAAKSIWPLRERIAAWVLKMRDKKDSWQETAVEAEPTRNGSTVVSDEVEQRNMVSGVLTLAERSVHSLMTPRTAIAWVNIDDDPETIKKQLEEEPHSFFPVCRGTLDEVIGIGRAKRMVADILTHGRIRQKRLREPIIVHDTISILRLLDTLKQSRGQLVLVADEFGTLQGLITPIDIFEAIAGQFPDEDETLDIVPDGDNRWRMDGATDLHRLEQVLQTDGLVNEDEDYTTLAGYLLNHFGQLPAVGDVCEYNTTGARFVFKVTRLEGRRIAMVNVEKHIERSTEDIEETS